MQLFEIILISLSLSIDCFAVCACISSLSRMRQSLWYKIPLHFGIFQAGMAILGYILGSILSSFIYAWDHWLAFALLAGIGIKILYETYENEGECPEVTRESQILMLSVATSIDAFAIGITLGIEATSIAISSFLIGITSLIISLLGLWLGTRIRKLNLKNLGYVAGIVLIGLGIKTLWMHL